LHRPPTGAALRRPVSRELKYGLFFISPSIFFFLVFWLVPVLLAVYYSLTNWKLGPTASFVGLKNYADLFYDPRFVQSLRASAAITGMAVATSVVLALGLAVLLNDDGLRGSRLFKVLVVVPVVTDWVATGLVWQLVFLPNRGVLPGLLSLVGLRGWMGLGWTSTSTLAPVAIAIFIIWKTTGLYAIIFLAGLKGVPRQYAEAAVVDGANSWQVFRVVTLPLIRPITVFVVVTAFVSTVGLFEPVFMLTGGGPADTTRVLPIFLYETFFQFHNGGYASAAGIVFLLVCLVFALGAARMLRYSYYE
jgi:ABC-type sugar transport system permease subunit